MSQLEFIGKHLEFLHDETPELDLEGSRSCGKTILCLWKELEALKRYPGMWSFLARFDGEATKTLLMPELERVAAIHGTDLSEWDSNQNCYLLPNESRIFSFGLKTISPDPEVRYKKIRGLSVSRIYIDQAEELPGDIASELRFPLRPNITAKANKQAQFPRQLTFSPNPADTSSWLAKQFPISNKLKGRRYYSLSLYDNRHNLDPGYIEGLELEFPPEHPKHQTLILGLRGPTIIGEAIYDKLYNRAIHKRPLVARDDAPILEAFEVGKHNPYWIAAQRTFHGGLVLLGGIKGQGLMLEDFLPIVKQHQAEWFGNVAFKGCASPMGDKVGTTTRRVNMAQLIRKATSNLATHDNANAPDVQLAMIEEIAGLLRRRTMGHEEALGVNSDPSRWLVASNEGIAPRPFMSFAFDGGYVWSEEFVSVSHDRIRKPKDDDDYANAMKCVETIVLTFFANQRTDEERARQHQVNRERGGAASFPDGPHSWLAT